MLTVSVRDVIYWPAKVRRLRLGLLLGLCAVRIEANVSLQCNQGAYFVAVQAGIAQFSDAWCSENVKLVSYCLRGLA